jgi:hypothetical protein
MDEVFYVAMESDGKLYVDLLDNKKKRIKACPVNPHSSDMLKPCAESHYSFAKKCSTKAVKICYTYQKKKLNGPWFAICCKRAFFVVIGPRNPLSIKSVENPPLLKQH